MQDFAEQHSTHRELELMDYLRAQGGSARTAKLAKPLGVSEETVRRTVKSLARSGLVERVHGGVYLPNAEALSPVGSRLGTRTNEKLAIAREAARHIASGSTVFLDVGSTTAFVAESLKRHRDMTIVTNGLHAAQALIGISGNRVFLAGGELRPVEGGTFGQDAIAFISRFSIDTAVFSVDGIDRQGGFLLAGADESDLARAVAEQARRTIVVGDQAKFGKTAALRAFDPQGVDMLITDANPDASFRRQFDEWQIEVIVAG